VKDSSPEKRQGPDFVKGETDLSDDDECMERAALPRFPMKCG
jgi:hypothetical protein